MYDKPMLAQIFETIWKLVGSDGGDGTGIIFCTYCDYKDISKLFKEYIDKWLLPEGDFVLEQCNGYDLISDRQNENFIITSDKKLLLDEIEKDFGISVIKI